MKRLIVDLDDTISFTTNGDYKNALPDVEMIEKLVEYKNLGFDIIINTSRNMRTYSGVVGLINKNALPIIIEWLDLNNVPYDEIYVGKPWCGFEGFYIDDKSIRPDEFKNYTYEQILKIINK